jgi:uncharacterized protein YcfJ
MKRPAPVPHFARALPATALLLIACCAVAAPQETVLPVENVRVDYAQVLRVQPVYQTLHATRAELQCDPPAGDRKAEQDRFSRVVGSVRGLMGRDRVQQAEPAQDGSNCRTVTVDREYRRPIAYDVDYLYRGMKYRSRLSQDPGNRLRVRVSVTPYVQPLAEAAPRPADR